MFLGFFGFGLEIYLLFLKNLLKPIIFFFLFKLRFFKKSFEIFLFCFSLIK